MDIQAESLKDLQAPFNVPIKPGMNVDSSTYDKGSDQIYEFVPALSENNIRSIEVNDLSPDWTTYLSVFLDLHLKKNAEESLADMSLLNETDQLALQERVDRRKGVYVHSPDIGVFVYKDESGNLRVFATTPSRVIDFDNNVTAKEFKNDSNDGKLYLNDSEIQKDFVVLQRGSLLPNREQIMSMLRELKVN